MHGILFMNSKAHLQVRELLLTQNLDKQAKAAGSNDYVDYGIRMAHAFSPKLAAKANFTYMRGTDWYATNYDDKTVGREESCEL
jgi:hypothetical protein